MEPLPMLAADERDKAIAFHLVQVHARSVLDPNASDECAGPFQLKLLEFSVEFAPRLVEAGNVG